MAEEYVISLTEKELDDLVEGYLNDYDVSRFKDNMDRTEIDRCYDYIIGNSIEEYLKHEIRSIMLSKCEENNEEESDNETGEEEPVIIDIYGHFVEMKLNATFDNFNDKLKDENWYVTYKFNSLNEISEKERKSIQKILQHVDIDVDFINNDNIKESLVN